jgi:hypothetical protein
MMVDEVWPRSLSDKQLVEQFEEAEEWSARKRKPSDRLAPLWTEMVRRRLAFLH